MPPRKHWGCRVQGCDRNHLAKGLCALHYQRKKKGFVGKAGLINERHGEKEGRRTTAEYRAWQNMRQRCSNELQIDFKYYGGRGIKVCEEWSSFSTFLRDMGRRPSKHHTLDRRDTNGNYEKSNCRWITRAAQSRNRRPFKVDGNKLPHARKIEVDGVVDNMTGWSRRSGITRAAIKSRLRYGWEPKRAVTEPVGTTRPGPKRLK